MKIPLARLSDKSETLAEALPKFETVEKVRAEKCLREKSLQKYQGKVYRDLFKKLKDCHPLYSCGSAACPECFRKHRLEMIGEVLKICKKRKNWRCSTLIFYQDAFYDNELLHWRPDKLIARLRRWLNECGFDEMVIGGFELDFHSEANKWMPHFHLIIPNDKNAIERLRLKMKNKRNMNTRKNIINRPVLVSKLKKPMRQVSYRFKAIWCRVESIQYDDYYIQGSKERKRKRWTKKYRLLRKQYVDSLIKLDSIGIAGLTFMYKVRKYGDHLILK
ncbi:hypothetical protein [Serratia liquefaciens]|uniref:hypothetical protein n=1 Tax=Serratia liquefaciens TaxID=614 RepID=UPI0021573AD6|nr:hypothetical protein [Serratia liquefaciens]